MNKDISIRILPFGTNKVKGFASDCGDAYIIAINADISEREQFKAILHELAHIYLGHFERDAHPYALEKEAHNLFSHDIDLMHI